MSDANERKVNFFPETKYQALAMLYVQNQDLKGKSPIEILDMYETAYKEIYDENHNRRKKLTNNQ